MKPKFVFNPDCTRRHSSERGGGAAAATEGAQTPGRVHARGSGGLPQAVDSVSLPPGFVFRCWLFQADFGLPSFRK